MGRDVCVILGVQSVMDTVRVDGVTYTKVAVIAKKFRYTKDYVGQLCRSGKVDCQFVGRSWYVSEESLLRHKDNRYAETRVAEKTINNNPVEDMSPRVMVNPRLRKMAARQLETPAATSNFLSRLEAGESKYFTDETELLPQPLKATNKVRIEPVIPPVVEVDEESEIVENSPVSLRVSTTTKPKKLAFTDVPAVPLRGQLRVEEVELQELSEVVTPESILALAEVETAEARAEEEIIDKNTHFDTRVTTVASKSTVEHLQTQEKRQISRPSPRSPFTPEAVAVVSVTPSRLGLMLSIAVVTASVFALFVVGTFQVFLIEGSEVSATIMFSFDALLKLL